MRRSPSSSSPGPSSPPYSTFGSGICSVCARCRPTRSSRTCTLSALRPRRGTDGEVCRRRCGRAFPTFRQSPRRVGPPSWFTKRYTLIMLLLVRACRPNGFHFFFLKKKSQVVGRTRHTPSAINKVRVFMATPRRHLPPTTPSGACNRCCGILGTPVSC